MSSRSLAAPATATFGLLLALGRLDRRLRATGGVGIIPFELAGQDRSVEIMQRWGAEGQRVARTSLLLDYPFLVAYTTLGVRLTAMARSALGSVGQRRLASCGPTVTRIQIAAGACDAIENAALIGVVARSGDSRLAGIARTAATVKFAGLTVGWLYGAAALVKRWMA